VVFGITWGRAEMEGKAGSGGRKGCKGGGKRGKYGERDEGDGREGIKRRREPERGWMVVLGRRKGGGREGRRGPLSP
jgi:hypothetical protein